MIMKTKFCFKCKIEKDVSEFNKNKNKKDGLQTQCRECFKQYRKDNEESLRLKRTQYYKDNAKIILIRKKQNYDKDAKRKYNKQYYQDNQEKNRAYSKQYRNNEKNKEAILAYRKQYRKDNKVKGNKRSRQYYKDNRERLLTDSKRYGALPGTKLIKNKWRKKYMATNPKFKLNCKMSSKINKSLCGAKAGLHWEDLVGYTLDQLKVHLEKQFDDKMTWENYGKWHIDHKIPLAVHNFTSSNHLDFKRAWSLENLQPLWAHENLSKGKKLQENFQPSLSM